MIVILGAPAFPPDKGGASIYFDILYKTLKSKGFNVTVITYGTDRDDNVKGIGIKRWYRFIYINFILSFLITFIKFLKIKADVIHVHTTSGLNLALSIIGWLKRIPIIRDVRDLDAPSWIIKFPKADLYIVCCRAAIDYLREKGIEKEKIIYIPPPINLRLEKLRLEKNTQHNNEIKILYVGELTAKKGLKDILGVSQELYNKFNFSITIVGDGPLRDEVIRCSRKVKCIKYVGAQPHEYVLRLMASSDILVLPSYDECYPRVVIESLAMGCAVLAYDVGDIRKIVGNAGVVCEPGYENLKKYLEELLSNPEKIRALKKNTYKMFRKHPNFSKTIKEILDVYKKILNLTI